ncbi:glycosyltransferase [Pedobacter punctiformis]|uniref:Glycosyl transferase n=1 Tax=Pedobacter punctiformis TaxID=3004097 RepID=A0ABT4L9W5_9SPHI|nr:glycosyltransferase [Pedobacter sp. HCMS5-2]MCZ4244700.1 hypothetical protein [Pedobacter sp. HCMS5-2]
MLGQATIYTITKGNYKFGVIALVNSLIRLGVKNKVIIGTDIIIDELVGLNNVDQFIINSTWNPTNLKGKLILDHPSDLFIYFDADIIVTDRKFIGKIEEIITDGKFCTAVDGIVPQNDYRRHLWRINSSDLEYNQSDIEHPWYYNAGFFAGNFNQHQKLLFEWYKLIEKNIDPEKFIFDNEDFPMADQDMYNALLQNIPLNQFVSFSMPDWVGISTQLNPFFQIGNFRPHAFIHCTGEHKPWKIKGVPKNSPNEYDVHWYRNIFNIENPVRPNFKLTRFQHMWFNYSLLTRIISKLKRRFNFI